ncbi:MAG TPA: Do family serine endopeptidase [Rhizomicrobium sp.]
MAGTRMRRFWMIMGILVPSVLGSPAFARGAPDSFADLASQLLPTVVNISTTQTLKAGLPQGALPELPPDSPLHDLFRDYLQRNKNLPRHITALGSGFVIDPSGLIVTNDHVIDGADQISVTFNDGTVLPATVVGRDEKTDLALVRVHAKSPLAAAHFGNSDEARVGDWVIAIGDPFGLGSSVTAGIVSARNRNIAAGPYDDFIQTDAPINRGNSGGALFDMQGNVVGVTSAIFSPSGGSVGVGFAIPSNMARDVVAQLRTYGAARRGWIGVRIQQVTSDIAESLDLVSATGALVADVTPNGPAAKAGLQNGDLIVAFDGKPVVDSRSLPRMVADTPVGKSVGIGVLRKGSKEELRVTVAKLDESANAPAPAKLSSLSVPNIVSRLSRLGFGMAPLDDELRAKFKLGGNVKGVVITDVDPDGPAAEKNLQPGDVILEVQNEAVHSPDDVTRRVEAGAKAGRKAVLLLVSRDGQVNYVGLSLGEPG